MGGFNVYGQLIRAQLEQWASDPTPGVTGRIGYNSVTNRFELDNGSTIANVIVDKSSVTNYLDWIQVSSPVSPASGANRLYFKADNNLYSKNSGGTETLISPNAAALIAYNFLYNSDFSIWQRYTTTTVTSNTNSGTPTYKYIADRWYCNNVLGGGSVAGIITGSQVAAVTAGSAFGLKLLITTAPTGTTIQNGCELYQVLENLDSLALYNQTASFGILVKAFGNVNQVGVQFYSLNSVGKPLNAIGSEVLTTVNTSTFTRCVISGQALGTAMTTAGVIGVRIRITGVASGNAYDLNNGFSVEQATLNLGTSIGTWVRKFPSFCNELVACQRYYEKNYDLTTNPGTSSTSNGELTFCFPATLTGTEMSVQFSVSKLSTSGTGTYYSSVTGTSGKIRDATGVADLTAAATQIGTQSMGLSAAFTSAHVYFAYWTYDCDI